MSADQPPDQLSFHDRPVAEPLVVNSVWVRLMGSPSQRLEVVPTPHGSWSPAGVNDCSTSPAASGEMVMACGALVKSPLLDLALGSKPIVRGRRRVGATD